MYSPTVSFSKSKVDDQPFSETDKSQTDVSRLQDEISFLEKKLEGLKNVETSTPRPRPSPGLTNYMDRTPLMQRETYDINVDKDKLFKYTPMAEPWGTPRVGNKERVESKMGIQSRTVDGTAFNDEFVTHRRRDRPRSYALDDDVYQHELKRTPGVKVKPATYDGTGSWIDYEAHFKACAEINEWSERQKGMYLAVSLRGQAQGVFGNLPSQTNDYGELSKALRERFSPPNQTELYRVQLRDRRQKASESLSELGQAIRRLANQAYPTAPADVRELLLKSNLLIL